MKNILPVLFALLILSSCRKKEENIAVESVTIDKGKTAEVYLDKTLELKATVLPENATSKEVAWNSSDPSIATVSGGIVTPVKEGETIISATAGGVTANCTVKVIPPFVAVSGISLDPATVSILIEKTSTLKAVIAPENASDKTVVWSSDKENIATVSDGVIAAKKEVGTCTITAKSFSDQTKVATCEVKVVDKEIPVTGISVIPKDTTLIAGASFQLRHTITPAEATNVGVTYETSGDAKATVSESGSVTAGSTPGKATITVKSADNPDKTAACSLTITKGVETITLSPGAVTLSVREKKELSATVMPADAGNKTVTWSSSDESKATVSTTSGEVTAVAVGDALITATAADGSGVKGTAKITVQSEPAVITGITLGTENFVAAVPSPGETTTLNNAPHTIAADRTKVQVDITATEGAIIQIGETAYSKDKTVDFTNPVKFTVTEAGKTGSKEYTLTIPAYNKESNPYGIYTVAHLHDVRNALDAGFKLMNDLTMPAATAGLSGIDNYGTEGWLPIGDETNPFTGSLDGAGHKIDNFFTDRTVVYVGLFGKVGAASIKDLSMNGVTGLRDYAAKGALSNTNKFVGILAGYNAGTIANCHASGNVYSLGKGTAEFVVAGGLVGYCIDGTLNHCSASGRVSASSADDADAYAGGLAGYCDGSINDSYATGKVSSFSTSTTASTLAGGLLGLCYRGNVIRCYATGEVSSNSNSESENSGAFSGGLVGHCDKGTVININNCFATGKVTATCDKFPAIAGGLLGYRRADNSKVSNNYATGDVTAFSPVGKFYAGGFMGYNNGSTIHDCYWNSNASIKKGDTNVTPGNSDLDGTPKPLTEMQDDAFTTSLNAASSIWGRDNRNNGLPYIKGVGIGK